MITNPLTSKIFLPALVIILIMALFLKSRGQSPVLPLKDINVTATPAPVHTSPQFMTGVNGTLFFSAQGAQGRELWKSNGKEENTEIVKDIMPGSQSANPFNLTAVNEELFFTADDGNIGIELYKTDGTFDGTMLVKEINPGAGSSFEVNASMTPVNGNGILYFTANDGVHGYELWRSDGTADGTYMLKEFLAGQPAVNRGPSNFLWHNNTLFFRGYDEDHGWEFWKSDGTEQGTVIVKDVLEGIESSAITTLTASGDLVYFVNNNSEIWRSDGTGAGTFKVGEVPETPSTIGPPTLMDLNGQLYFYENSSCWTTDGTVAGTKAFAGGCGSSRGNFMFFNSYVHTPFFDGFELWRNDGTESGRLKLTELNTPEDAPKETTPFIDARGTHIFISYTQFNTNNKTWLWKSDGTVAGTKVIKIFSHPYPDLSHNYVFVNNTLYFLVGSNSNAVLWKSDGTTDGTMRVTPESFATGSGVSTGTDEVRLAQDDQKILFSALENSNNEELWISNGTESGTKLLKEINSTNGSFPRNLTKVGSTFYFTADNGTSGRELWKSDGTASGTQLVKDLTPGTGSSDIFNLFDFNGLLVFTLGNTLYKSDGTNGGTQPIKEFGSIDGTTFTVMGSELFFYGRYDVISGLWKTDGTTTSVVLNDYVQNLTVANGTLFFFAGNSELWRSDGTTLGTYSLKSLLYPVPNMTSSNNLVFFTACDNVNLCELWKSDGTPNGTVMVKDINPGDNSSYPQNLTDVDGQLVFTCKTNNEGLTLWKSDGTSAGTTMLFDLEENSEFLEPTSFKVFGDDLYFFYNHRIWHSGNVTCSTVKATERLYDPTSTLFKLNDRLIFSLTSPQVGNELHYAEVGWTTDHPDPHISSSPVDATYCLGSKAKLSVSAIGSDLTYKWYRGATLVSSTGPELVLESVSENDEGSYHVEVTSSCASVVSDDFTLTVDPSTATMWYLDADNDGLGGTYNHILACEQLVGYVSNKNDCDDANAALTTPIPWYPDEDSDRFGYGSETISACFNPPGYALNNNDCDDSNIEIFPNAPKQDNGLDNDCDGDIDFVTLGVEDNLNDGFATWPNPSNGTIELKLSDKYRSESVEVRIVFADGKSIQPTMEHVEGNAFLIHLDRSGVHNLLVRCGDVMVNKKIIVYK